jgi:hypothetical protein
VREIRTLRAMWRALETGPRRILNGHEEGNLGHKPRRNLRAAAPALDPTEVIRGGLDACAGVLPPRLKPTLAAETRFWAGEPNLLN